MKMLWLLAYLIVGMVYASLDIYSAVRKAIKKDKEHGHIILMSSLFLFSFSNILACFINNEDCYMD